MADTTPPSDQRDPGESAGAGSTAAGERGDAAASSSNPTSASSGRRRRRANVLGGRHHAHRVKVTPEEESRLLVLATAQGISVPRLLIEAALAEDPDARTMTASERHQLIEEMFIVKRLLANIANNVNQIARVANSTGEVRDEAVHYTREARRLVDRLTEVAEALPRAKRQPLASGTKNSTDNNTGSSGGTKSTARTDRADGATGRGVSHA